MNKEQLYMELLEKMHGEQDAYRSWLLEQPPEEILIHTYEFTAREDILTHMESMDLSAQQAAELVESSSPLADIYKDFRNMETGVADLIQECVTARADHLLETRREREENTHLPLYWQSGEYAREHGEMEAFRASREANTACRDAIDKAIQEGFDGWSLTADPKDVLAEFGPERVAHVLAATLQARECDARFSRDNMAWAASLPMPDDQLHRGYYELNSHSAVLDGFVRLARKEMDAAREQPEKKPSIRAQLGTEKKTREARAKVEPTQKKPSIRTQLAQAKASQTEKDAAQRQKPPLGKDMDAR